MKEAVTKTKEASSKRSRGKLSSFVNFLNDAEKLFTKHHGKDEELDSILRDLLSKSGSVVEKEVERKKSGWATVESGILL